MRIRDVALFYKCSVKFFSRDEKYYCELEDHGDEVSGGVDAYDDDDGVN